MSGIHTTRAPRNATTSPVTDDDNQYKEDGKRDFAAASKCYRGATNDANNNSNSNNNDNDDDERHLTTCMDRVAGLEKNPCATAELQK